ncbi:MAG: lactate utilization protein C [Candidatus Acidiferrum sp.]
MSAAKSAILERIRKTLSSDPTMQVTTLSGDYAAIARTYAQQGNLDPLARLQLFEDRLRDYGSEVYRASPPQLQRVIGDALTARHKRSILIPLDLPSDWLPPRVEYLPDRDFSYQEISASEGVLTGCSAAIALTGTIVLCHPFRCGRRALTLIPDYHLCVVHANQLVETVHQCFQALADITPRNITTISGSSATSDIEMTRIKGVHGPRTLDVVIVSDLF